VRQWRWRTLPDGRIEVTGSGGPVVPQLTGAEELQMRSLVIVPWGPLAARHGRRVGIPAEWLLGAWWTESRGNPNAMRRESNGWIGVGLGQITHPDLKSGLTDDQLRDPETNATISADYMATLARTYDRDLPRVAAAYNAGSARPSPLSAWDLFSTRADDGTEHVTSVVCAANTAFAALRAATEREMPAVSVPQRAGVIDEMNDEVLRTLVGEGLAADRREHGKGG
jgi:hypothetical protein